MLKKSIQILLILIVSFAVIYKVIQPREPLGDPVPVSVFVELGNQWIDQEIGITQLSGLLGIKIKNSDGINYEEQYQDEMTNTRFIKFKITGGKSIYVEVLDADKNVLRTIESLYLMDYSYQDDRPSLVRHSLEHEFATTEIYEDDTGRYWPIEDVIASRFQPMRDTSLYIDLSLSSHIDVLYSYERENGDIKLTINKYGHNGDSYVYRPSANNMLTEYFWYPGKFTTTRDDFIQECDVHTFAKNHSFEMSRFKIESTILEIECE